MPHFSLDSRKWNQIILVIGDAAVFIFFAAEGRATHDIPLGPSPVLTVLGVAAPFAVPWFFIATLTGVYRLRILAHPWRTLFWTAVAWISAGCIGLVARTIILQRALVPLFAEAALGVNAAMLLGWHLILSLITAFSSKREGRPRIRVLQNAEEMSRAAAQQFEALAKQAVSARGRFTVALSGGETPQALYRLLAQLPYQTEISWPKVRVFWGDERCVPPDHPESNYHQAQLALLDHVPIPPENIHRIRGELDAVQAANDYASQLRQAAGDDAAPGWPRFDLVLLGLGSDGHTASLFPGNVDPIALTAPVMVTSGEYQGRPAQRVTLTLKVFNAARNIVFLVTGESKAAAVAATLEGERDAARWPAQRIRPTQGSLTWMLDRAAASYLKGK